MKRITEILSKETAAMLKSNSRFLQRQKLQIKEFSVFDNLEIKRTGSGLGFLVLKIADISILQIKHISRVVNAIHLVYGKDDNGRGKFSEADIDELNNYSRTWTGRSWLESERYMQPAMIRCDDSEGLKLFIMNV